MKLYDVVKGVEQCMSEATEACNNADEKTVRNCLLQAGDLIKSEIGDGDAVNEEPAVKEGKNGTNGHCQPNCLHEAQAEPEETQQGTGEESPANQEQEAS